jgi:hypothetical protein
MSYVTKPADPVAAAGRPPLAKMPALKPRTVVIPGGGTTDYLVIPSRFCGPPGSGNGGYVCGRIAAYLDGPVTVTLRRPPPLATPMTVERRRLSPHPPGPHADSRGGLLAGQPGTRDTGLGLDDGSACGGRPRSLLRRSVFP